MSAIDLEEWKSVAVAAKKSRERRTTKAKPQNGQAKENAIEITEGATAEQFADAHNGMLRYCHDLGSWFQWDGTRWKREQTKLAYRWAHDLAKRLSRATRNAKAIKDASKASFAGGVERIAQSDRAFAVTSEIWDQNPWLLATPGGTIDLKTGKLSPARQSDHITRSTTVAPSDTEDCPKWRAFLEQATKDDVEMVAFLKRWFGYCLTGITREHAMIFAYGIGGNGKGTAFNTIFSILGDYAVNAAMETFMTQRHDRHTTDLAMLAGARFILTSEVDEGQSWAEAKLKALTAADPMTARFMRHDNFTFIPVGKINVSGNHKPTLSAGVDDAMKRRFNMIPFVNKPEVPDLELADKLKAELSGILRWLINGCRDWQVTGLAPPEAVNEATRDYFEAQDIFGRWLTDCCTVSPGVGQERPAKLLASYQDWCKENAEPEPDNRKLRPMLERMGLKYVVNKGARIVRGISLKPPPTPPRTDLD